MERIVVDLSTGEQRIVPLTEDEIAALKACPPPQPPTPRTAAERLKLAGFDLNELRELLLGGA
jgi:hypothetical protein